MVTGRAGQKQAAVWTISVGKSGCRLWSATPHGGLRTVPSSQLGRCRGRRVSPFLPRVPVISSEASAAPRSRAGLEAELWLGLQGHLLSHAGEGGPVGGWQPLPVLLSPPHLTF